MDTDAKREPTGSTKIGCIGKVGIAIGLLFLIFVLLMPGLDSGPGHREAARRSNCTNNLKHIGVALQNYHNVFNSFPPAFVADGDGKPLHSWRVLLLPYFEDEHDVLKRDKALEELYRQYDFSEPWNGPNNRKLIEKRPDVYGCPTDVDNKTGANYLAVVGPQTAWPGARGMNGREITDDIFKSISVVEVTDLGVAWSEPRDLTFDEAAQGINPPVQGRRIASKHNLGAQVLTCGGVVYFLSDDLPRKVVHDMLTAAGGETIEFDD